MTIKHISSIANIPHITPAIIGTGLLRLVIDEGPEVSVAEGVSAEKKWK